MAVRQIRITGDEILTRKCRPVEGVAGRTMDLIEDMFEIMYKANGYGSTAPQVDVLKRVFVVDVDDGNQYVMINPEIITQERGRTGYEDCLGLPGKSGIATHLNYVKIWALSENVEPVEVEGEGLLTRTFCCEYAYLEGQMHIELAERELADANPETSEEVIEEQE